MAVLATWCERERSVSATSEKQKELYRRNVSIVVQVQ